VDSTNRSVFSQKLKEFYWTATRTVGLGFLHDGSRNKYQNGLFGLLFYPLYVVSARVLGRASVRFLDAPFLMLERVGHLAIDFDSYLKDQLLSHRKVMPILLCAGRKPANEALLTHWSQRIIVVRSRWICWLLRPLLSFPKLVDSLLGYCMVGWQAFGQDAPHDFAQRRGACRAFDVQSRWADRTPLIGLSEAEIARGEAELRRLEIPEGAWFVCVHAREGGYSPSDEWQHSFRNANITDYLDAMQAIVARGGWCVRVGDPTMRPLDPMPGAVDYALSSSKSDWMDLFLCARCRFFLGNTSGLYGIAGIFGKPSALANMTPLGCAYGIFPNDISIPKLMMDAQGRMLPLPDAFAGEASELYVAPEFVERGLRPVDNTSQEIAELAIEMMDRLDGNIEDERDDADLQARFRSLIQPHHYCWHTSSRIGRAFLRRHRALLLSERFGLSDKLFGEPVTASHPMKTLLESLDFFQVRKAP
jgi:putative glycosyltransferase (TIGR04372 family)